MKRNKFSLSNHRILTGNMGELIPCGLLEVLPGDTIQHATSALIRCAPLVAPPMHPVHVRIHHWYVPHRLVWEEWEDFITGGPDGMDASEFPTITFATAAGTGSLADYLGLPPGAANLECSALPFRGYAKIWNEYYRDQDLQAELTVSEASGVDTTTNRTLQLVAWEKDYFTSSRPWEQKGPTITVPIGGQAPVKGIGKQTGVFATGSQSVRESGETAATLFSTFSGVNAASADANYYIEGTAASNGFPNIYADLSNASAVTINLLREAFALQRFEEARARFGSRYVEYLRYLGVRSSDARLQRPEYLGGGKQTIQFSEVLATAETEEVPVGDMKGHGIGAMRSNRYRRFFEEHGYVFSFISVKPRAMYSTGVERHWNRRTKEDFWQKELQHIGQQEVLQKEIYYDFATRNDTFGFQDRYDEYRRQQSLIAGEFRTIYDGWHFARTFGSAPALNADFVKCVPTERPFANINAHALLMMTNHSVQARRLVAAKGSSFIF